MAESLVVLPDKTDATTTLNNFPTYTITQHLTELTRKVLGCQHIGLLAMEPQTDRVFPIATAGFTLNDERKKAVMRSVQAATYQHARFNIYHTLASQ